MALQYQAHTASEVLSTIMSDLLGFGDEVGSRNGRAKELLNTQIILNRPQLREIITEGRKANIYAQIAETMWVLAGRDDIEWLGRYLPRAKDFSDDGETWRGAYGPRIRNYRGHIDQLYFVVDLLRRDPLSRRAVISIYDPMVDTKPGKDIPCNDFLQFQSRGGELYLTVTTRSNDAMWGWSGINAFEWSVLQEIVASLLGIDVGPLTFNIGSLHLYSQHWAKASRIALSPKITRESNLTREFNLIRFNPDRRITTIKELNTEIVRWFDFESKVRQGVATAESLDLITDPLFRVWAAAIAYYWTRDNKWLNEIPDMAPIRAAMEQAPQSVLPEPIEFSRDTFTPFQTALPPLQDKFHTMVSKLHAEKHASYGDSWKKRGEHVSILANIARKVDRLGVGDTFDSELDTVVDLLVYSIKYLCWLQDLEADPEHVDKILRASLHRTASLASEQDWQVYISQDYDEYIDTARTMSHSDKVDQINDFIQRLTPIAVDVWYHENEYRGADAD